MANIKFSQFTTTSPADTVSLVGYLSTNNVKFTIADLKTQFNNSYVTLGTVQSITSTKQFVTSPILGDQTPTITLTDDIKLYSSHDAESSWIFNSVGVYDKIFSFRVNDLRRWAFSANQDAESGSTAGTNFEIRRYNDGGTFIDSPISITRSDGTVAFGGNIQLLGSMQLGDSVTLSNGELQALDGVSTTYTIQDQLNSKGFIYYMSGGPASVFAGAGVEQTLATITIPADVLEVGDRVEVYFSLATPSNTGTKSIRVRLNNASTGTALNYTTTLGASVLGWNTVLMNRVTATNTLIGSSFYFGAVTTTSGQAQVTATIDITTPTIFYFNAVRNGASDTVTLLDCYIKILK